MSSFACSSVINVCPDSKAFEGLQLRHELSDQITASYRRERHFAWFRTTASFGARRAREEGPDQVVENEVLVSWKLDVQLSSGCLLRPRFRRLDFFSRTSSRTELLKISGSCEKWEILEEGQEPVNGG